MNLTPKLLYEMPPKQVVRRFYTWYLGYIGQPGFTQIRNPLVDKAYWSCPELTDGYVQQIDDALDSSDTSNYDPFLCAPQDTSINVAIGKASVSGDKANVVVHTNYFEGHQFTVELTLIDGMWKMSHIICSGGEK